MFGRSAVAAVWFVCLGSVSLQASGLLLFVVPVVFVRACSVHSVHSRT